MDEIKRRPPGRKEKRQPEGMKPPAEAATDFIDLVMPEMVGMPLTLAVNRLGLRLIEFIKERDEQWAQERTKKG